MNYLIFFFITSLIVIFVLVVCVVQVKDQVSNTQTFTDLKTHTLTSDISNIGKANASSFDAKTITANQANIENLNTTTLIAQQSSSLGQNFQGGSGQVYSIDASTTLTAQNVFVNSTNTSSPGLDVKGLAKINDLQATSGQITGDKFIVPIGTTEQRPTPQDGMIRYNQTTGKYEGYSTIGGNIWSDFCANFDPLIINPVEGQTVYYNGTNWVNGIFIETPTINQTFTNNIATSSPFTSYVNLHNITSVWELWSDPLQSQPITTQTLTTDITTFNANLYVSKSVSTHYFLRVKYLSEFGGSSEWSDYQVVVSTPVIITPYINTIDSNGDASAEPNPFQSTVLGLSIASSSWQLFTTSTAVNPIVDQTITSNFYSFQYSTQTTLQQGQTYYARVRYNSDNSQFGNSAWSGLSSFVHQGFTFNPPSGTVFGPYKINDSVNLTINISEGIGSYTITIPSSNLPSNLLITPDDTAKQVNISGTITQNVSAKTNYTFTVHVEDSDNETGQATYTLQQNPSLIIEPQGGIANGSYNTYYSQVFTISGGTAPYHNNSSLLPAGLDIRNISGGIELYGTLESTSNPSLFTLDIVDSNGFVGTYSNSIIVDVFIDTSLYSIVSNNPSFPSIPELSSNAAGFSNFSNEPGVFFYPNSFALPGQPVIESRIWPILENGKTSLVFQTSGVYPINANVTLPSSIPTGVHGGLPPGLVVSSIFENSVTISGTSDDVGNVYAFTLNITDANSVSSSSTWYLMVINGFGNSNLFFTEVGSLRNAQIDYSTTTSGGATSFSLNPLPNNIFYYIYSSQSSNVTINGEQGAISGTSTSNELYLDYSNLQPNETVNIQVFGMDSNFYADIMTGSNLQLTYRP